jgi:glycosyltransferase involved in cell wall biosynthesis
MMESPFSRRSSARWGRPHALPTPRIDVLIPTRNRPGPLAVTLAGLAAQDDPPFDVVISDQSDDPVESVPFVASMIRVLRAQEREVHLHRHPPGQGMAEQRQFLLDHSDADRVLYLDDDVWLEPGSMARMDEALGRLGCGFVGQAVQGLSYLDDFRPSQHRTFTLWEGDVTPETVVPHSREFDRYELHNAANLVHIAAEFDLSPADWVAYKVAWCGGCVLFDRAALTAVGGFDFWRELPPDHIGEDVLAQLKVMRWRGGAGILPSGAVHLEEPTTLPDRTTEAADFLAWPMWDSVARDSNNGGENDERATQPHPDSEVSRRYRLPGIKRHDRQHG